MPMLDISMEVTAHIAFKTFVCAQLVAKRVAAAGPAFVSTNKSQVSETTRTEAVRLMSRSSDSSPK